MSGDDNLPVILISAVDATAALALITELMNDGTSPPQCNGAGHSDDEAEEGPTGPVWHLTNKYYSAAVRLHALPDTQPPPADLDVQAHIIYLTENECSDAAACARRGAGAAACGGRGGRGVRLVAARAALEPAAPAAWARAQRYELVALLAPPDPDPYPEPRGLARLREALHAHVWPNMRRAGRHETLAPAGDSSAESSEEEEEWGAWRSAGGEEEEGAVGRAEQFADALALLPASRDAHGADDADDATRRLRAEHLVAAFCRALGHDLHLDDQRGGGTQ